MELIADILLVAGAVGAGFYCFVLSRRLSRFNDLETGMGGAVAVLSSQVDDLNRSLVSARAASDGSNAALDDLTRRAESVAGRLELLMASLHDIPEAGAEPPSPTTEAEPARATEATEITGAADDDAPSPPMAAAPFIRHARGGAAS
ncbi:hypothetical protein [Pontibaca methylaminivorans]|uniref:Uncharacterized protein n=1 Tax=Pontibaca methylaminivorans TaxID=515897 RepID=A0A1R3WC34_9RHOB|nr:hypothetical protein [Pontibaca methylaminivorans]SIT75455.1 hypothetical protein SAMN05421849_0330 [Pontibaca methylaminivorans]